MSKKSRISKDAFGWVKDTSKEEEVAQPEKEEISKLAKEPIGAQAKMAQERKIYVRYNSKSGDIVSMAEIVKGSPPPAGHPYANLPPGETVNEFTLAGDLQNEKLIDIHQNFKVDPTRSELIPIPKQ